MAQGSKKVPARFTPEPMQPLSPARAFVVQFREGSGKRFSGRVEHMISGHAVRFESPAELLDFFARVQHAAQPGRSEKR